MNAITEFQGPYRFLSNFWPCEIHFEGLTFPSVEHAYVAAKTTNLQHRETIRQLPSAGEAKRYGRKIKLRSDWEAVKLDCMLDFLEQKFALEKFGPGLLETGDRELIEGNRWGDTFWGVCEGVGENHLGRLLMKVRADLF